MRIPHAAILAMASISACAVSRPAAAADHATFHQSGGIDAPKRSIAAPEAVGSRRSEIRIDPVVSASSGSFAIDRIRLQSW